MADDLKNEVDVLKGNIKLLENQLFGQQLLIDELEKMVQELRRSLAVLSASPPQVSWPSVAITSPNCTHTWVTGGIGSQYCSKCGTILLSNGGISWSTTVAGGK